MLLPPMHEMSYWEVVQNSPEWVNVFANVLFGAVTIGVVFWQGLVMDWQNKLMQLEHEHDWSLRSNAEREQILKLARKLHFAASSIKTKERAGDKHHWGELQDNVTELDIRLRTLDVSVYTGTYDNWYPRLSEYVSALLQAVIHDYEHKATYDGDAETPTLSTRKALNAAEEENNPIHIFLDAEAAIRMEFLDFKDKWDAATQSSKLSPRRLMKRLGKIWERSLKRKT